MAHFGDRISFVLCVFPWQSQLYEKKIKRQNHITNLKAFLHILNNL